MEKINYVTPEKYDRGNENDGVIKKVRHLPKAYEGSCTTNCKQPEMGTEIESKTTDNEETETMSFDSETTITVRVINFKRYLRATIVQYISMKKAIRIRDNTQWDPQETVG